MSRSTSELRQAWKDWSCAEERMKRIEFGADRILVIPETEEAWSALARVFKAHGYHIRTSDTDSYNCRKITGGSGLSLHAFGIALDVNWGSNPFRRTPSRREIKYSNKPSQFERALDVKALLADTDMTVAMIEDILAIQTKNGKTVFAWGGHWQTIKDAMHFQIDLTPAELAAGIDWKTVKEGKALFVQKGDRGPEVEYYQRKLSRLSPVSPGEPDGAFGPLTAASVEAFQKSRTPPIIEGESGAFIGPWTKSELDLAEAEGVAGSL